MYIATGTIIAIAIANQVVKFIIKFLLLYFDKIRHSYYDLVKLGTKNSSSLIKH